MEISGVSSSYDPMNLLMSGLKNENIQQQIAVSVVNQIQDAQKNQGQALVNMIQGLGTIVDRSA